MRDDAGELAESEAGMKACSEKQAKRLVSVFNLPV